MLQEQALGAGVDLWLHTRVADVDATGGRIGAVILHSKSGLQALRPAVVIDCTGDGDVVHQAGFPTARGRESDGAQLPMSSTSSCVTPGTRCSRTSAGPHRPEGAAARLRGRRGPAHALGLAPGGRQGGAEAEGDRARRDDVASP